MILIRIIRWASEVKVGACVIVVIIVGVIFDVCVFVAALADRTTVAMSTLQVGYSYTVIQLVVHGI